VRDPYHHDGLKGGTVEASTEGKLCRSKYGSLTRQKTPGFGISDEEAVGLNADC
jgi:hypothetical protein